uniref:Spaetzle domain-containing protein n=1 Tax=Daphnia galeata TaxID=27404 RepID=A0A8J2RNB2_9CRUS|nr:unnamed protein product [Daphnia galeata]
MGLRSISISTEINSPQLFIVFRIDLNHVVKVEVVQPQYKHCINLLWRRAILSNNVYRFVGKEKFDPISFLPSLFAGALSTPELEPSYNKPSPLYGVPPKYEQADEIPHSAKNTQSLDKLANTDNSVDGFDKLNDEFYLCLSSTDYVRPLRAINVEGKWRTIVNGVESYGIKYTQTARVEECDVVIGTVCPLVTSCYASKCVQKNIFHRFLVFNPNNYKFPFTIVAWLLRMCSWSF